MYRGRRSTGSPHRTCIGCRRTTDAHELVRCFRGPDGLELGSGPGRGAWLCIDHPVECLDLAIRRRAVGRALRVEVSGEDLERLRAKLTEDSMRRPPAEKLGR